MQPQSPYGQPMFTGAPQPELQQPVVSQQQNPFQAKMIRTLLDAQTGKATKEEIEEFRKTLLKIERKN